MTRLIAFSKRSHSLAPVARLAGCLLAAAALVTAQAALAAGKLSPADLDGLRGQLATALLARAEPKPSATEAEMQRSFESLLADPAFTRDLARHEALRACEGPALQYVLAEVQGRESIALFLNDEDWMQQLLASGPVPNAGGSLRQLYLIWKHDRECLQPLYKTLATAVVLRTRGEGEDYNVVRRFRLIKQIHQDLQMHASFDKLHAWEMRLAIETDGADEHLTYLVNDRNYRNGDYFGACWACAYKGDNRFGDTIQGPLYFMPWNHAWPYPKESRLEGGVCGTLSTYGATSARAHGIPAMTAGQPGHCAYCVRDNAGKWRVTYDVDWPTTPHELFWGGTFTMLALMEDVYQPYDRALRAHRYEWLARLLEPDCRVDGAVRYRVFKAQAKPYPTLEGQTVESSGECFELDVKTTALPAEKFAVEFTGTLKASKGGSFRVQLAASKFARVFIDGRMVADTKTLEPTVPLTAGAHPFRVEFYHDTGKKSLTLSLRPTEFMPATDVAYRLALREHPVHYGIWRDYGAWLGGVEKVSSDTWKSFALAAAKGLQQHQEAAWQVINGVAVPALAKTLPGSELGSFFAECHRVLRQQDVREFDGYPFDGILNTQADFLKKDKEAVFELFRSSMQTHLADSFYFGNILKWGRARFSQDAAFAPRFGQLLTALVQSDKTKADLVRGLIRDGITEAERTANIASFQMYSDLVPLIEGTNMVADLALTPAQFKLYPKPRAFTGDLLSAGGVLQLSTSDKSADKPSMHRRVLQAFPGGGYFRTAPEKSPQATVVLKGKGELSGIAIVNRYESADGKKRCLPMTVSVSEDGKKWMEVFRTTEPKDVWEIDLAEKKLLASHVRIETDNSAKAKPDPLHLRQILVYGRKLY